MNHATHIANPFYASRLKRVAPRTEERDRPVYARLPLAPRNASPVPHLTSLYHFHRAGEYGDRAYPGNCGGNLIKDLLQFFRPEGVVLDPMSGQRHLPRRLRGTRHSVRRLGHSSETSTPATRMDFPEPRRSISSGRIHPTGGRRSTRTTPATCRGHRRWSISSAVTASSSATVPRSLKPGGKLAILMGDYSDRDAGYVPLVFHTKRLAFAAGLAQHCTDIIRFSHGASSSKKVYRSSFIPGLHDVCMIFEKTN